MNSELESNLENKFDKINNDENEDHWILIESYFRGKHLQQLVKHQIESYNDFVNYQVQKTISMYNPVNIRSENDLVKEIGKYRLEIFVTFEDFNIYRG